MTRLPETLEVECVGGMGQPEGELPGARASWQLALRDMRFRMLGIQLSQVKKKKKKITAASACKLLAQKSQKEDGVNGITEKSFTKYLFPLYPELARQFFAWVHRAARARSAHVAPAAFRAHCERVLAMLDDDDVIDLYVRMFSEDEADVGPERLRRLLLTSFKLAMDHHPEGPRTCPLAERTLAAVVRGCFNNKERHSVGFVVRWLGEHGRRLVLPVHRYCVHVLATRHRALAAGDAGAAAPELGTPVLARAGEGSALLPLSAAWLLAGAAPALYSRPRAPPAPGCARAWLARLVCAVPSHWEPLYAAREHGLGANRFLHHTLAYRGPTVVLLQADELLLAVCCPAEWRETHQYWGGPDCALVQLLPSFALVERGPKMLYLNTSIRGYPRGLRVGADPRKPTLDVPQDFDALLFQGARHPLADIEVWGCGDPASREAQLEVKKWQVKEAERQRCVKLSAAEWMDHPDRYLLELAGRPQYNNSAS